MPKTALVILARTPEEGKVKTRLAATIGSAETLRLYQAFLRDLAQRFTGWQKEIYTLHWAYTPSEVDFATSLAELAPGAELSCCFPQCGPDFESRLQHAFRATMAAGFQQTILIGSDTPHLSRQIITQARQALEQADVVLGPADDGGYYLIALRQPYDLFSHIPMSTPQVLRFTLERAQSLGLRVHLLETLADVDTHSDLLELQKLLVAQPELAPASAIAIHALTKRAPMPTPALLPLPRSIYIEPTSRCNEFCQQCPRTLLSREDDRDLTFEQFCTIVDQFPVLERVVLHGLGEPLLNKDLPQMVRYLKARGTYVLFNSNGIALTERRGRELIEAGLDEYRLSMDGATRETYAQVRSVDAFEKIWGNIQAFIALQKELNVTKPAVSLWFTAMRANIHELPQLIELAHEHGVCEVYMQRLVYFEKGLAAAQQALFHRATPEEMALIRRCEQMCQERGIVFRAAGSATPMESITSDFGKRPWAGCRRPYSLTYITSSGNVLSCCFAPFGHHSAREYAEERVLGNIFQESLEHIWHGERYQAFRRAFESEHPARHCAQCGLNWSY